MAASSGATASLWLANTVLPALRTLDTDLRTDVCVVGAGIAGMTTAYELARTGISVVVLDRAGLASGETGRTTAHLTHALDTRYAELERLHGRVGARLAAESHTWAIDRVETHVRAERIACGFTRVDGHLFTHDGGDPAELDRELEAAQRAGLRDVQRLAQVTLLGAEVGPCLRFPRQAQFHPVRYLAGLAAAFTRLGGRIYGNAAVTGFDDGPPARVTTEAGRHVTAEAVVVAAHSPSNDRFAIHTKQAAYRTYAIGLPVVGRTHSVGLYWDTADPYHYIRTTDGPDGLVVIVGGEDHKTGQADDTDERFARLETWVRGHLPAAGPRQWAWSGQIMEPVDGLGFIGRNPGDRHTFIVTGDSGNGMTHGTIAGQLLRTLISGDDHPWARLYDPSRITPRAAGHFARENLNVARQYADLVTGGDVASVDDIPAGTGAVVRDGLHKRAVFRDDQGALIVRSAVCPHLGCIVGWNAVERTWDCPCHGSRFAPDGEVIAGPATRPLSSAD